MNNSQLYEKIQNLCGLKGVSINRMLSDCSINPSFMQDLKNKNTSPSIEKILRISDYFKISTDFLIKGECADTHPVTDIDPDEQVLLEEFRQLDAQERRIILGKIAEMNYNKRGNAETTEEIGIHFPVNSRMPR